MERKAICGKEEWVQKCKQSATWAWMDKVISCSVIVEAK